MVKCLIIDDEKNARDNLNALIEKYCPQLEVVGFAVSGLDGLHRIEELRPDAIFLDVHMADMDGFSVLGKLDKFKPMVVFVTAFDRYAMKAIRSSAIDYILKPISIKELQGAAEKLEQLLELKKKNPGFEEGYADALKLMVQTSKQEGPMRIALPDFSGYRFESVGDVVRLESDSNYTNIHLKNGEKVLVSKPMKHFEDFLDDTEFVRIHNSHIINVSYLKGYLRDDGGMAELMDGTKLHIAKRRLPLFLDTIKNRFLKP
jgi:two-component system LytT family response regulator